MTRHDDENLLNGELARLLRNQGIVARAEQREGRRKLDVVADIDGLRVVLEAETGFDRKRQAIKDADARLFQALTNLAFAICYPAGARTEELADATLQWTLRTRMEGRRVASEGDAARASWTPGGISALAAAVKLAPNAVSDADRFAQQLSGALDAAVNRLSGRTRRALAQKLDLPRTKVRSSHDDAYFAAAKRGLLVIATAMLFHHRVQEHLPRSAPADWQGAWPPASPSTCAEAEASIQTHRAAWQATLAVDYRPVFETAIAALDALPTDPDSGQMTRQLAWSIGRIAERTVGLRHDLLGRVFHRVLDTARYDGSFYTSTAAATLLATLAIRPEDVDWDDPDAVARLRICDPACGTGTLLMAAAERISNLRSTEVAWDEEAETLLAEELVENVLWGYDVNLTATHLAASTLGMLSPKTQFRRMNIHRVLLGVFDGVPYLGSVEFLTGQPRLAAWPSLAKQVDTDDVAPPPPMDLVIMNPPFTRDSLRHDQFSRAEEQAIKRREKAMLAGRPHRAAARLHSSGGVFTVLGEDMLKTEKGVLALVLPTVVATAPGNLALRQYLAERFHIDTVVSSHDPERIFFSESTKIGEMLLICRRWKSDLPKTPTRVVNLAENPATPLEALRTAEQIDQADPDASFTLQRVQADRIAEGDWYAINFLSPYLVEAYRNLGGTCCPLSEIAIVGPAGQRIRDSYRPARMPTALGRRALWYHKTDVTTSMRAETDVFLEPKLAKRHLADSYWEQRSVLLLPARMRLNTSRVASVMLDEPAVGSLWIPCRAHDIDRHTEAALCVYLNSSMGLLALLGARSNRVLSYPAFSLDALRAVPVPDFRRNDPAARDALVTAFTRLKNEPLMPLPRMATDPVRRAIDDAVTEALGINAEWVATVRRELAAEPSITNRRLESIRNGSL